MTPVLDCIYMFGKWQLVVLYSQDTVTVVYSLSVSLRILFYMSVGCN